MNTANLFVPFFTTKPEGSGIGLPLSRQIAEAHGGSLVVMNRRGGKGAEEGGGGIGPDEVSAGDPEYGRDLAGMVRSN